MGAFGFQSHYCICRIRSHVSNTLSSGVLMCSLKGKRASMSGWLYWLCSQLTATVTYVTEASRYRWFKHEAVKTLAELLLLHQQLRISAYDPILPPSLLLLHLLPSFQQQMSVLNFQGKAYIYLSFSINIKFRTKRVVVDILFIMSWLSAGIISYRTWIKHKIS